MKSKRIIYVAILTLIIATTTACNKTEKTNNGQNKTINSTSEATNQSGNDANSVQVDESLFKKSVVKVGKEDVYYSEAMIYFKYIEAQYQDYFGDKIWSYDFGGQTFGDMAKREIIDMITQTKIIGGQAENYNIVLMDEDEAIVQQKAQEFLAGLTEEDKLQYGLTKEVAEQFYRDNKKYEYVYDAATMNVNTDVSDEDAKQITVQHIFVSTTQEDASGKLIPVSEDKKQQAYKKAQKLLKKAKKADDFKSFAAANTDDPQVEYVIGKGTMELPYETAAFALKTGELSDVIETTKGYYIIYCASEYNEDATLEKKEQIIEDRQDKYFQQIYEKWAKGYKVDVNEKVWNGIVFKKPADEQTAETTPVPTKAPSTK